MTTLDDTGGNTLLYEDRYPEKHHPAFNSAQEEQWEIYASEYHDYLIKNENRY